MLNNFIVIDIETTGTSSYAKIIEFSGLKYENDVLIEEFTTLVNPGTKIPPAIVQKTGITDDMVKDSPQIKDVINRIIDFINNQTIVGYNIASFDIPFIRRVAEEFNLSFNVKPVDLLPVARRSLPSLSNHKLVTVAAHYGIDAFFAHRAKVDCLITYKVYLQLKDNIVQEEKEKRANQTYSDTEHIEISSSKFKDSIFVLTGDFDHGTKDEISEKIEKSGGTVKKGVTQKTNYLVVGGLGNDKWKYGTYGGKIEKAKELQTKGFDIHIISESDLFEML